MTCSKCGRDVPVGAAWCGCGGPAEFSSRDRERMRLDVRARVLWADPVETIREEWLKKGAPGQEIRAAIDDSLRERRSHFRARGFRDLLTGVACFAGGAAAAAVTRTTTSGDAPVSAKGFALILVATAALPAIGLWFTWRGVRRLATGGAEEKGASDVEG